MDSTLAQLVVLAVFFWIIACAIFLRRQNMLQRRPTCPPGGHSWRQHYDTYICRTCGWDASNNELSEDNWYED